MQFKQFLIFKLVSFALCCVVLAACAQQKIVNNSQSPIAAYERYSSLLNEANQYSNSRLEEVFSSYSLRYQTEILNKREKSPTVLQHLIENYLSFPLLLKTKINHLESINNNHACLIINGKSTENEKIAFYISFVKAENWLLDAIAVEHMADYNKYFTEANCSKEFRDDFRFKEMAAQ